jgi:hypothetical protein
LDEKHDFRGILLSMSQENVEIVRRIFPEGSDMVTLINDADLLTAIREGVEPYVDPDFETVGDATSIPIGTTTGVEGGPRGLFAKGIDGFVNFWREWNSAWASWTLGTPEFIDVDENRVLILHGVCARPKTFQVDITIEAANLMTLRDGKVTRIELFFDHQKALESVGLSE